MGLPWANDFLTMLTRNQAHACRHTHKIHLQLRVQDPFAESGNAQMVCIACGWCGGLVRPGLVYRLVLQLPTESLSCPLLATTRAPSIAQNPSESLRLPPTLGDDKSSQYPSESPPTIGDDKSPQYCSESLRIPRLHYWSSTSIPQNP